MDSITSHKDLVVWRFAIVLAGKVYAATANLPREEVFGLGVQLRRAAVSIPSNIAEGSARRHRAEFIQHLHIARGSLAELETQLMIAGQQHLITDWESLLHDLSHIGRLLNSLIRRLSERRPPTGLSCQPLTANR